MKTSVKILLLLNESSSERQKYYGVIVCLDAYPKAIPMVIKTLKALEENGKNGNADNILRNQNEYADYISNLNTNGASIWYLDDILDDAKTRLNISSSSTLKDLINKLQKTYDTQVR